MPPQAVGGHFDLYVAVDGPIQDLEKAVQTNVPRYGAPFCQLSGAIYAPRPIPPPDSKKKVRKDYVAHFLFALYPSRSTSAATTVWAWSDPVDGRTWGIVPRVSVDPIFRMLELRQEVLLHDLHQSYAGMPEEGTRLLQAIAKSAQSVLGKLGEVRPSLLLMLQRLEWVLQTGSPCVQRRDVVPAHEACRRAEFLPANTFPKAMAQRLPLLSTPMPAEHTALPRLVRASLRCTQECREEFAVSSVQHFLPVDMLEDASVAFVVQSESTPKLDRGQLAYGFFLFIPEDVLASWASQPLQSNVLRTLLTDMPFGIITSCSVHGTRLRLMMVRTPPDPAVLSGLPVEGEVSAAAAPPADEDAERPLRSRLGAILVLMSAHEQYFTYHALYRAIHLLDPCREAAIHAFDPPFAGLARPTRFLPCLQAAWRTLSVSDHLTEAQKLAAVELATRSRPVTVLQGCPGCGKSFILLRLARTLCDSIEAAGLLVIYMSPTRVLRDEMSIAAATVDVFPEESQRLVLGRSDDWGEDSYTQWLFRRLEEQCPALHRELSDLEAKVQALPREHIVDPSLQELAKAHHDRTLQLYVREWQARKENMMGRVRFVAMTRTLGMRYLGKLTSAGDLLKDRKLVIIADEIEDWLESPLVAAAGHAQLLLCSGDADQTLRPVQRMLAPDHLGEHRELLEPMHGSATSVFDTLRGDNVPVVRLPVTRRFGPLLLAGYRAIAHEGSEVFECDPGAPNTEAGMIIFPSCCWTSQEKGDEVQHSLVGRVLPGPDVLAVAAWLLLRLRVSHERLLLLTLYDHVAQYVRQALHAGLFAAVMELMGIDNVSPADVAKQVDVRTVRSARGATGDAVILFAHKRYLLDDGLQGQFVDDAGMRRVAFSRAMQRMFVFAEEAVLSDTLRDGRKIPGFGRLQPLWPSYRFFPSTGTLGASPRGVRHAVDPVNTYDWNWLTSLVRAAVTSVHAAFKFRHRPVDSRVAIVAQMHDSKHRTDHATRVLKALRGRADARVPTVATEDAAQATVEAHNQSTADADEPEPEAPLQGDLLRWLEKAQRYAVPSVHWHIGNDSPGPVGEPRRFPNLVAIPFFQNFLPWPPEWDEHLQLARLFCPPEHRLRLVRHKGHSVQTQHSVHYWKECHSDRFAVAVERTNVAAEQRVRLYAYHGMGTKRMLPCLTGIVLRVADLAMVHHVARQLGAHWPIYTLRPEEDCVVWDRSPEGTSSVLAGISEAWHEGRASRGTRLPLQLRDTTTVAEDDAPSGTGWCG